MGNDGVERQKRGALQPRVKWTLDYMMLAILTEFVKQKRSGRTVQINQSTLNICSYLSSYDNSSIYLFNIELVRTEKSLKITNISYSNI